MSLSDSDPFGDPISAAEDQDYIEGATLPVGRSASLTLATDSLIVLGVYMHQRQLRSITYAYKLIDEEFTRRETRNCCGLISSSKKNFANGIVKIFR